MCSNETLSQSLSSTKSCCYNYMYVALCIVVSREKRIFFSFVLSCLGIYERKLKIRPILVLGSSTFFWTVGLSELFWGPEKRESFSNSISLSLLLFSLGIQPVLSQLENAWMNTFTPFIHSVLKSRKSHWFEKYEKSPMHNKIFIYNLHACKKW